MTLNAPRWLRGETEQQERERVRRTVDAVWAGWAAMSELAFDFVQQAGPTKSYPLPMKSSSTGWRPRSNNEPYLSALIWLYEEALRLEGVLRADEHVDLVVTRWSDRNGLPSGEAMAKSRRCAVYRLYDGSGRLLYVGKAFNPADRFAFHRTRIWWDDVDVDRTRIVWYFNERDALDHEDWAIRDEHPVYNRITSVRRQGDERLDLPAPQFAAVTTDDDLDEEDLI